MSVEELKTAAANLPPEQRLEFADWLAKDRDVSTARLERLRSEIKVGLDQIERGEYTTCRNEAEMKEFFERIRARGRARLAQRQSQPSAA